MKKIILIYPDTKNAEENMILPLSLVYIATPLKDRYEIRIIDQRVDRQWKKTLSDELRRGTILCAGISSMTGPQISGGIEAARIIREHAPEITVVWGGVHPSLLPEQTIQSEFVDIIVVGDGEETFSELADTLDAKGDKKNIAGIVYKEGASVVRTPAREQFPISTLDSLSYEAIDIERYKSTPLWTDRKSLPVITSRGCPFRCSYCYNLQFSKRRWTSLTPEQTVSSIERLISKYDISGIFLLDDNFFVNFKRAEAICRLIIERGLNISVYNANCRVDTVTKMDDSFLQLMKKAGFNQLFIGVESGSDSVLQKIHKDITVEQVMDASAKLKKAGIRSFYSFMAGFPFETIDDIKKTLHLMDHLLKENPEAIVYKLQLYTPFPGTTLFEEVSGLGMTFPATLEGWAGYHYDHINYKGFTDEHRRFLEDFHLYTTFLDKKLHSDSTFVRKLISGFYSRILHFRIDHGFYTSNYELYPLKIGLEASVRLSARC
jgi:anaerobic magnesium-protoporphyrin IX monomethyl ester cyclase